MLTLIMFNLLIAIISKTFEDVEANKELTDMHELVEMLLDYGSFASFFNCVKNSDKKYLHLAIPLDEYSLGKFFFSLF